MSRKSKRLSLIAIATLILMEEILRLVQEENVYFCSFGIL